ncbi:uncharacterized protein MONOS_3736 [Monocercomonoides exilis]|uniref:uncharacterized protein n=1 Tax=Monocercomonoides exilis TaxID=2049356 RepID=UPI003559CC59|nr:hypothetical protein MONOS_3736 [Monocercomonoides exilis]|eukprot:MONOS_3736.1-p1 / transcript=MONOS_3736.1 / gene=MONOS_3736 / organism=Monocercomonoides_exilis_PA203 / gene_product=unspecified product / transcript_product=unspecified product / location=Mono_scaffold00091:17249-18481(+) / protein_length=346 / sequence_SO=supercontig / SO=protein_coding / is_pseudo=false
MERLLTPLKTGLQPSLVWTLSTIRGIYGDKIAADMGGGSTGWGEAGAGRQEFGDFVCMWLGEKHAAQKKSEAERWAMVYGVELFRKDFAEVWLFGKFVREEFTEDELSFFLFSKPSLFERGDAKGVHGGERELSDGVVLNTYDVLSAMFKDAAYRGTTNNGKKYLLCVCYPQTPQALSQRFFLDAYRLSGCCLPLYASVLEVCKRNVFFTLCVLFLDVCDAADRRAPLTASENSAVVKTMSRHLALLKPALDDRVRVLSGVSAGVSGGVLTGAGLKRRVEAVQSAVGKKEGRRALFRMVRLLVELVGLPLGCIRQAAQSFKAMALKREGEGDNALSSASLSLSTS